MLLQCTRNSSLSTYSTMPNSSKKLSFANLCLDPKLPRIGGGALIGSLSAWPSAPSGNPLSLVASLPTEFLNENAALALPKNHFISVFSYYDADEYFLDSLTYHGSAEELEWIKKGFTRVLIHEPAEEVFGTVTIPAMTLNLESMELGALTTYTGSKIGGEPGLLQAEPLALCSEKFALQLYGGCFPASHKDIFGLSDAVGYLFIKSDASDIADKSDMGTFFVQVT
jgi:hypothetical protein